MITEEKKMKKMLFILILLGCIGCVQNPIYWPSVTEIDVTEYMGLKGKSYQGKVWISKFVGSGFCSQERAYKEALKNAAKKTNELGYNYFSVLTNNTYTPYKNVSITEHQQIYSQSTITGTLGYNTINTITNVPINKTYNLPTVPHSSIIFIVLDEQDLHLFQNIYSINDYK